MNNLLGSGALLHTIYNYPMGGRHMKGVVGGGLSLYNVIPKTLIFGLSW